MLQRIYCIDSRYNKSLICQWFFLSDNVLCTFPKIGVRGAVERTERSNDLYSLDCFMWGYLKSKLYLNRSDNVGDWRLLFEQIDFRVMLFSAS